MELENETSIQAPPTQTAKFESARALRDSLRFAELRKIKGTDRTTEEAKEYARLYSRNRRKAIREDGSAKGQQALKISKQVLANIKTVDEFWAHNKSMTSGKVIHQYLEMQERYLDELHWLNYGWELPPDDEDFVSLEDGIACMDDFIRERGYIHDEKFKSLFLQDFRPQWAVWVNKVNYVDPFWGRILPYWQDERFHELCKESEATAIYARYGIRTAFSQYHVRLWKGRIAAHKDCHVNQNTPDDKCWACLFERTQRERAVGVDFQ